MLDCAQVVNRRVLCAVLCALSLCPRAFSAQATNASPAEYVPTMTFDVASVREAKVDIQLGITVSGGFKPINSSHLRVQNFDLMNLLTLAYPVNFNRLEGMPPEFRWAVFNVEARTDPESDAKLATLSKEQVRTEQQHMMQALLADRFKLKVHWETRDRPTYNLVVGKAGRLKTTGEPPTAEEVARWGDRGVPAVYQMGSSMRGFEYIAHGATTADIANMLTGQFGRPVNDKTGLMGKYDFHLKTYQVRSEDRKMDETNPWPPLENAVEDQLGLKLVSSHGPVRVLLIDHVEKPSEN